MIKKLNFENRAQMVGRDIWGIFIVYIIANCLIAVLMLWVVPIFIPGNLGSSYWRSFIDLCCYLIIFSIVVKYVLKKWPDKIIIERNKWKSVSVGGSIVFVVSAFSLSTISSELTDIIPKTDSFLKIIAGAEQKDIFSAVSIIILAPILEEYLCRGLILKQLLRKYSSKKAIIISSVFFSWIHMNIWQGIPALILGIYFGWMYSKTHSLFICIVAHSIINTFFFLSLFIFPNHTSLLQIVGLHTYFYILSSCLIAFLLGFYLLKKHLLNKKTIILTSN